LFERSLIKSLLTPCGPIREVDSQIKKGDSVSIRFTQFSTQYCENWCSFFQCCPE